MDTHAEIRYRTSPGIYYVEPVDRICGIQIYDHCDGDYGFIATVHFIDPGECDRVQHIGCQDTWLKIGETVYRTEGDFYRLKSELEREKIEKMLGKM